MHESLLLPVLMYGSEKIIWEEREMSRIRTVQMGQPQMLARSQECSPMVRPCGEDGE